MTKKEARAYFKEKRTSLSPTMLRTYSEQIAENLFSNFKFDNKIVSLFMPIERQKEINTYIILDKLQAFDIEVCIPKSKFETLDLKHYRYTGPDQLELSEYGIPEPKGGKIIPASKINCVIVPLLAIDKNGNRAGYGKGFYDRFLKKCAPNTVFIGLSLFDPIDQLTDVDANDIKLHYCLTPEQKFIF